MNTHDLMAIGRILLGKHFIGVFPLDKFPKSLHIPNYLIINTHTANLPGEHWLAVAYIKPGTIYAFDSFGMEYPPLLMDYLKKYGRIRLSKKMIQSPFDNTCGMHAIQWLMEKKKEYARR
jgi:hypothetical protein